MEIADALPTQPGGEAGPIVWDAREARMYVITAVGAAGAVKWPPGVRILGSAGRQVTHVVVPALEGATGPLLWRPPLKKGRLYVDIAELCRPSCVTALGRQVAAFPVDRVRRCRRSPDAASARRTAGRGAAPGGPGQPCASRNRRASRSGTNHS